MPRIEPLPAQRAGWLTKLLYRAAKWRFGAVPEPLAVAAHHPKLLMSMGCAEFAVDRTARRLPANLRELATYRAATRIGCSWCVDFGTMVQRNEGLDIDRLKEIDDYPTSPKFTARERTVLAYADAMTDQPMRVTDDQVAELDRELGHDGLVELTYMIALENERSRFNHALGLTAQGFTSGEACRVPVP
ncbi:MULTISPECIES: carboxymuconolactone decarboxylase family protein [unclassified Saccharopolyspora]|uniref:carboxymuconolactone decarboxylase family protein n=1 Tax=Saccharopolyspora TaxID=1835 RepID=UPI00190DDE5D|nr:carboxymuconolactone decarboxylase family protein [Saccharopolyspora sp. HNM0986]MBK0868291.1 carboxymuconolactone decarboxylase family protein [Saccharopolyspora sp. HNM0986]